MHRIFLTLFALLYTVSGMICYCARLSVIAVLSSYKITRIFHWQSNDLERSVAVCSSNIDVALSPFK